MTDLANFLSAVAAAPACDVARLALADWLDEHGTSDRHRATAEFVRLSCTLGRRGAALPVKAGRWLDNMRGNEDGRPNWQRLVPTLAALLRTEGAGFSYRRTGRTVRVARTRFALPGETYTDLRYDRVGVLRRCARDVCDIEFVRGFVGRVVFRDWRFADVVLPLVVADQPFAEPELTGFCVARQEYDFLHDPIMYRRRTHPQGGPALEVMVYRDRIGPAFDRIPARDIGGGRITKYLRMNPPYVLWNSGPENDAFARARRAVAAALRARARAPQPAEEPPGIEATAAEIEEELWAGTSLDRAIAAMRGEGGS